MLKQTRQLWNVEGTSHEVDTLAKTLHQQRELFQTKESLQIWVSRKPFMQQYWATNQNHSLNFSILIHLTNQSSHILYECRD